MARAAKCFYASIDFDAICSTGEEVQNPKRNIPLSIVITLFSVSFCYCVTSIVLTMMIPYYIINPDGFHRPLSMWEWAELLLAWRLVFTRQCFRCLVLCIHWHRTDLFSALCHMSCLNWKRLLRPPFHLDYLPVITCLHCFYIIVLILEHFVHYRVLDYSLLELNRKAISSH